MTTASQPHENEHRAIHDEFAALADGAAGGRFDPAALEDAVQSLRSHIWVEEQVLFPALRDAGAGGPVTFMVREHEEIWSHLDELEQILDQDQPDPRLAVTVWTALQQLLDQHNLREEGILHAHADSLAGAGVAAKVNALLETGMPADWTSGTPAPDAR